MGWVEEQFERRVQTPERQHESVAETRFELLVERKWTEVMQGLERDAEEYRRLGGDAGFAQAAENQWHITNRSAGVSALITVDLSAHTIQYEYESQDSSTAVPDGGIFTIRREGPDRAELYSSDQAIGTEQARRMMLEPLLFPNPPRLM